MRIRPSFTWPMIPQTVEQSWGGGESTREVDVRIVVPRSFSEDDRRGLFDRLEHGFAFGLADHLAQGGGEPSDIGVKGAILGGGGGQGRHGA